MHSLVVQNVVAVRLRRPWDLATAHSLVLKAVNQVKLLPATHGVPICVVKSVCTDPVHSPLTVTHMVSEPCGCDTGEAAAGPRPHIGSPEEQKQLMAADEAVGHVKSPEAKGRTAPIAQRTQAARRREDIFRSAGGGGKVARKGVHEWMKK